MDRQKSSVLPEKRKRKYEAILKNDKEIYQILQQMKPPVTVEEQISQYILVPAVISFVMWVLDLAQRRTIKRLYFLSRDGYWMYKAAKTICQKKDLAIECRYLYCSRYSLRIPMFHRNMKLALDYLCARGSEVTLIKIFQRAGISKRKSQKILSYVNLPFAPEEPLSAGNLSIVREKLGNCSFFLKAVEEASKKQFPLFCGYLRQEGLLEEIPLGIVDSGWVGSIQKSLLECCKVLGRKSSIEGFYWGLYDLPFGAEPKDYHCYFFSQKDRLIAKTFFSNSVFEAAFSAPHGMTLGYVKKRQYEPVFTEFYPDRMQFHQKFQNIMEKYLQILLENFSAEQLPKQKEHNKKTLEKLFRLFMCHPTKEEAAYFGNFIFDEDVLDGRDRILARPMNEKELLENLFWYRMIPFKKKKILKESGWYEGSAVLHGQWNTFFRYSYFGTRFLRFLRKEMKNRAPKIPKE